MKKAARQYGGECLSTEYVNIRTGMRWRCAQGYEWTSVPQNVRRGKWCKICAGKATGTIEQMRRLARERHGVCLSRKYVNAETKLSWRCVVGHRWRTTPHLVKSGKWCPMCGGQRRRETMLALRSQERGEAQVMTWQ